MNQPSNFLKSNTSPARHPPQVGPSRVEEGRAGYVPRARPVLRISGDGLVSLNAEAVRLLPKGDGTADLREPIRHGDAWHLDCRPGGLYKLQPHAQTNGLRFRALARVRALLGHAPGPLAFELEHVGNGLFRLFLLSV